MTNPTPKKRPKSTERTFDTKEQADAFVKKTLKAAADLRPTAAGSARTAAATAKRQQVRHERMAAELSFFGYRVFRPEDADRAPIRNLAHLAVQAPATIEELGPKVDPRFRSPDRAPGRG